MAELRKIKEEVSRIPLCVDLDGTFLKTDLLWEAVFVLLIKRPFYIFKLAMILLTKGKAEMKEELSSYEGFGELPVNEEVLKMIETESAIGREVILVTGSHQKWADFITRQHKIFSAAYGTTKELNLTGENKATFLVEKFGEQGFDYIGDTKKDIAVWNKAQHSYVVPSSKDLVGKVKNLEKAFSSKKSNLSAFIKGMRIYQWFKGVLVFAALFLAHKYTKPDLLIKAAGTFFSFGLVASSVYLFNDLCDLDADRAHPTKRNRPLAAGELSIPFALGGYFIILTAGLTSAYMIAGVKLLAVMCGYLFLNFWYSKLLKKRPLLDVFCLSSFYGIRVLAGGVATGIALSLWLNLFSFFIFLSLAYLKRYSEQYFLFKVHGRTESSGRDYRQSDLNMLAGLGINTGMMSILIFTLYQSNTSSLYVNQNILWVNCIFLSYWIQRMWLKAMRGQVKDDPIKFILKDKPSLVSLGLMVVCTLVGRHYYLLAEYFPQLF